MGQAQRQIFATDNSPVDTPIHWTDMGDPLADQVILALRQSSPSRHSGDWLAQIESLAKEQGGIFQTFLTEAHARAPDDDSSLYTAGQELFLRCAPISIACFVLGTLPMTYSPPGSAKVLLHTGRLRQDVLKRLYETATMVQSIMHSPGLRVDSSGYQTILKVRLLHAMVRQGVMARPGWPQSDLGLPINQAQMSLTAIGFSHIILRGLERLGVRVSERERTAYQRLWRRANALQGVAHDLLPNTESGEAGLLKIYAQSLMAPNDASRELTHAIYEALAGQAPFYLPKGALHALSRRLLDRELADALHIPDHALWRMALNSLVGIHRLLGIRYLIPGLRSWEIRWGRRYFDRLIAQGLQAPPQYQDAQSQTSAPVRKS